MNINIEQLIPVALPRHFFLTVYPNGDHKITERKPTARGKHGHFTGKKRTKPQLTICAFCPLLTSFIHN